MKVFVVTKTIDDFTDIKAIYMSRFDAWMAILKLAKDTVKGCDLTPNELCRLDDKNGDTWNTDCIPYEFIHLSKDEEDYQIDYRITDWTVDFPKLRKHPRDFRSYLFELEEDKTDAVS